MLASVFLHPLPSEFYQTTAKWAWISMTAFANLQGHFNRSIFTAPWSADVADPDLAETLAFLNGTDFIAYDLAFFDLFTKHASVEHLQPLSYQSHEAPCYIPSTRQLYFVEWGPPGTDGNNGTHNWQYVLDVESNNLRKITTDPPTINAHGCVEFQGHLYVVTDGTGTSESGRLVRVNPTTLMMQPLLNNMLGQPFAGFNDLEIDRDGNFWLTDSKSGWGRGLVDFAPPTNPTIYFVNGTTLQSKPVWTTSGNANGVAISPDSRTLYVPDTGVSEFRPSAKNKYAQRMLWAFDITGNGAVLSNQRMLGSPVAYFYDGIRAAGNGWLFAGSGDGVDVIHPITGFVVGSIRIGGGRNVAVSIEFGENELFIVGKGGVWIVRGMKQGLRRSW